MSVRKCFTLVEVLVAMGMLCIVITTLLPIVTWLVTRSTYARYDTQATLLLQEGMEISYNLAASDWMEFTVNYPDGIYHPAVNVTVTPNKWMLVTGEETGLEARFTRRINIEAICRDDITGEIVTGTCGTGSNLDEKSKYIVTTVMWKEKQNDKEIKSELLVTDMAR